MSKYGFKSRFQICFNEKADRGLLELNEELCLQADTILEALHPVVPPHCCLSNLRNPLTPVLTKGWNKKKLALAK